MRFSNVGKSMKNKNKNLDINFEKPLLSFAILRGFQTEETYGWAFRRHMEKTNEFPKILRNNLNNFEILLNFGLISRYYAELITEFSRY